MRTQAQIEAARRNGAKSRGPVTAEGKARSSRNAVRHGLCSQTPATIAALDPAGWSETLDEAVRDFRPVTREEHDLVAEIAAARWRIARAVRVESAAGGAALTTFRSTRRRNPIADDKFQAALAAFATSDRYETTIDRAYEGAVAALLTSREPNTDGFLERTRPASFERARQINKMYELPMPALIRRTQAGT
jgi:hypothetical protein